MVATCAGLGDSQAKPSYKSKLAAASARTGGLIEAGCCLFDRIKEFVKHEPRPAIHTEKQLGWAHKLGGAESLGISKVLGSNSVSQVDGFSDMAPACRLCGWRV